MKTIVMICRSKDEMPESFIELVKTLFPECRIQAVYSHLSSGIPKTMRMGGAAAAICITAKKAGCKEPPMDGKEAPAR